MTKPTNCYAIALQSRLEILSQAIREQNHDIAYNLNIKNADKVTLIRINNDMIKLGEEELSIISQYPCGCDKNNHQEPNNDENMFDLDLDLDLDYDESEDFDENTTLIVSISQEELDDMMNGDSDEPPENVKQILDMIGKQGGFIQ